MGISRDSRHKRRITGGKRVIHQKKRKYELGRPAAMTKLGKTRVHTLRTRGGNTKLRALKLEAGSFSWGSQQVSMKCKITNVVYSATSNDYVRTNTITKGVIVSIDSSPFKSWYKSRYGVDIGKKSAATEENPKVSNSVQRKQEDRRNKTDVLQNLVEQFNSGRLLACISSRPGQVGVANGYILEGKELEFYKKKLDKKRKN